MLSIEEKRMPTGADLRRVRFDIHVVLELDDATPWVDGIRLANLFKDYWKVKSFTATTLTIVHTTAVSGEFVGFGQRSPIELGEKQARKIDSSLCTLLQKARQKMDYPIRAISFPDLDVWLTCDQEWMRVMGKGLTRCQENLNKNLWNDND